MSLKPVSMGILIHAASVADDTMPTRKIKTFTAAFTADCLYTEIQTAIKTVYIASVFFISISSIKY